MALPANWQAAPATRTGRLTSAAMLVLFCGLVGAALTLFRLVLRIRIVRPPAFFLWKSSSPEMRFFLVVIAPYVLSVSLLFAPSAYGRSFAAGIATVTAVVFTYWEGLLFVVLVLNLVFFNSPSMFDPGSPPLGSTTAVVLVSLLCHVIVVVSSIVFLVRGLHGMPVFALGAILAGCYAYGVYSALERSQANYTKALQDLDKESTAAFSTVESISWCAIECASEHPEKGYPESLAAISGNPICKRPWSVSDLPHYSVTYDASTDASGRVAAFSVKAITPWNSLRAPRNAESDQSGVALIQYQDPHDNRYPTEIGTGAPLFVLWENKICFRDYAIDHKELGFPRKFAEVPNCYNVFRQAGSSFLSGTAVESGSYLFKYSPAAADRTGKTNSYKLEATCQAYGKACLHSFLLSTGQLYVATENRAATPKDVLLSRCPRGRPTTFCIQ